MFTASLLLVNFLICMQNGTESTLPEETKSSFSLSYSIFKVSLVNDASKTLQRSGWETSGMTSAAAPANQPTSARLPHPHP